MQSKASNLQTDPQTDQPVAKISVDDMVKHTVASASVFVSSAFSFVISGACSFVLHSFKGGKREDMEAKLRKLASEANVQESMQAKMLKLSAKLASKIAGTGTAALDNAAALRGVIQTAETPEDCVAQVGASIKADCHVSTFNGLNILVGNETKWTPSVAKEAQEAADKRNSASGKASRTRKANATAIKKIADKPELAATALMTIARSDDPKPAMQAILAGIRALNDRPSLVAIKAECEARLGLIEGRPTVKAPDTQPEQQPDKQDAA